MRQRASDSADGLAKSSIKLEPGQGVLDVVATRGGESEYCSSGL